jgi:hypothetical protein
LATRDRGARICPAGRWAIGRAGQLFAGIDIEIQIQLFFEKHIQSTNYINIRYLKVDENSLQKHSLPL